MIKFWKFISVFCCLLATVSLIAGSSSWCLGLSVASILTRHEAVLAMLYERTK